MNRIKTYLNSLGRTTRTIILGLAVIVGSAGVAQATTTTIDTSVATTNVTASGTLGVTGLSSFVNASTTGPMSVAGNFMINGMATTTSAGALSLKGTLTVAGGFLSQASSTSAGDTHLASTTAARLKVGEVGTQMTQVLKGTCSLIMSNFTVAASTTIAADCLVAGTGTSDVVLGQFATTSQAFAPFLGWQITGASASSTATYITFTVVNNTGVSATLPASIASTTQYLIIR